jgi:3-oxoacyl-[acyl-carrier protein] reductase
MTSWRDQVALVTGGARGIGRATARLLAQRGAAVCVNYAVNADAAVELVAEILAAEGRAIAAVADVAEVAKVEAMIAHAEKELGPVTILVNNAGVSWRGTLDTYDPEQVARMRRVNVEGLINTTRTVMKGMRERRYGRIVNVSSIAAIGTALPGNAFYAATKAEVAIFCHGAWSAQHHRERGGAWLRPNRHDAERPRRRRLAGDGGSLCCKGNDGPHRPT